MLPWRSSDLTIIHKTSGGLAKSHKPESIRSASERYYRNLNLALDTKQSRTSINLTNESTIVTFKSQQDLDKLVVGAPVCQV